MTTRTQRCKIEASQDTLASMGLAWLKDHRSSSNTRSHQESLSVEW